MGKASAALLQQAATIVVGDDLEDITPEKLFAIIDRGEDVLLK
jgi:hypothetical protein